MGRGHGEAAEQSPRPRPRVKAAGRAALPSPPGPGPGYPCGGAAPEARRRVKARGAGEGPAPASLPLPSLRGRAGRRGRSGREGKGRSRAGRIRSWPGPGGGAAPESRARSRTAPHRGPRARQHERQAASSARPPAGAHEPQRALHAGAVLAEALPQPGQAQSLQPHLRPPLRLRHGGHGGSPVGCRTRLPAGAPDRVQRLHDGAGGRPPLRPHDQHLHPPQHRGCEQRAQPQLGEGVAPRAHAPAHRAGLGLLHGHWDSALPGRGGAPLLGQVPPVEEEGRPGDARRGQQLQHHPWGGGRHRLHLHHGALRAGLHRLRRPLLPVPGEPQDGPAVPGTERTGRICPASRPAGPQRRRPPAPRQPLCIKSCA